jgi:hypothetical protein
MYSFSHRTDPLQTSHPSGNMQTISVTACACIRVVWHPTTLLVLLLSTCIHVRTPRSRHSTAVEDTSLPLLRGQYLLAQSYHGRPPWTKASRASAYWSGYAEHLVPSPQLNSTSTVCCGLGRPSLLGLVPAKRLTARLEGFHPSAAFPELAPISSDSPWSDILVKGGPGICLPSTPCSYQNV